RRPPSRRCRDGARRGCARGALPRARRGPPLAGPARRHRGRAGGDPRRGGPRVPRGEPDGEPGRGRDGLGMIRLPAVLRPNRVEITGTLVLAVAALVIGGG